MKNEIDRRFFLRASAMAGGGFMLGLYPQAGTEGPGLPGAGPALSPADFISIAPDGTATIVAKNQELGQGALNLLPMMIAEELDVDWKAVRIVRSGVGPQYGGQITGGSSATPSNWEPMRQIGRPHGKCMIAAAAQTWGVPPEECSTASGIVYHQASNRSLSYGELAPKAAICRYPIRVAEAQRPEGLQDHRQEHRGAETKEIIVGKPIFGIDVTLPGMLYAVFEKTPVLGGKVAGANLEAIKAMKGVRHAFIVEGITPATIIQTIFLKDPGLRRA